MMKHVLQFCGAAAMAALLCGCQSGGLPGWSFKSHRAQPVPRQALAEHAAILEEGKAQLRAHRLSAAAASFRMAMADPKTAAEANNGLAIVYAKLGRGDLADRYFRTALALDPQSQRFASNLLRLQHQVLLASEAALARLAAAPQPVTESRFASTAPEGGLSVSAGRIERVSRGVVRIRTPGVLGGAPQIQVAYRDTPAAAETLPGTSTEKADEARLAAVSDKSKTYPLRFVFER